MTRRRTLSVSVLLTMGFGLFALVAPGAMGATYGNDTAPDAALWGRYYGSAVFFLGVATILVLNRHDPREERRMARLLASFYALNLAISLGAQAGGVVNALGWTNVALQLAMASGLAYHGFARRPAAMRARRA